MKQMYKKSSAWMILVGLFLQISTPVVAAVQSSTIAPVEISEILISNSSDVSESVNVADFHVKALIEQIVKDAIEQGCEDKLSPALLRCYKLVSEDEAVIDESTLIEAMPELLHYAVTQEKMRAARPDAPTSHANNAIVACGGECDLTQLIRLLSLIRTRIGKPDEGPCCGTILGILGDACNVPCIGEDGSVSEVLCEILDCCTTSAAEIRALFTIIADIQDTITECCADIIETVTECCEEIRNEIEKIIQEIINTQTLIIDEFEQAWTILADIKLTLTMCGPEIIDTITNCCMEIRSDIYDTQTLIVDDFEQTWTILADIKLTLTMCGPELIDTITDCCAQIRSDIHDTQTLIIDDFHQTWTILADFEATVDFFINVTTVMVDIEGIFTVLDECCSCGPIPLFQTDVDGVGEIKLTMTGLSYCLAENITATIVISASHVTIDGNDREVVGRVLINASDVILKNTKVKPQAPVTSFASQGAILIKFETTRVQILDCFVECADVTVAADPSIMGRAGIQGYGTNILIARCVVKAGGGGAGLAGNGAPGGMGIFLQESLCFVHDSIVIGGSGGLSGTPNGSVGGVGGIGIQMDGRIINFKNSTAIGGNGGNVPSPEIDNKIGGVGGIGASFTNINIVVDNSKMIGGNGGVGIPSGVGGIGCAVSDGDLNTVISNSMMQGGNGGTGPAAAGGGATGGIGCLIDQDNIAIRDSIVRGGNGGDRGVGVSGGDGGIGINLESGENVSVVNSSVSGGDGSSGTTSSGGDGGKAITANDFMRGLIEDSTIRGGNGGSSVASTQGTGGDCITITNSNFVSIHNSTVAGGIPAGNGTPGIGIVANGVVSELINNIVINNSIVTGGNGALGINLTGLSSVPQSSGSINNTSISDSKVTGISAISCNGLIIKGCAVTDEGISLTHSIHAQVCDNNINRSNSDGISITSLDFAITSSCIALINNVISASVGTGNGIEVAGQCSDISIIGCECNSNLGGNGIIIGSLVKNSQVINCITTTNSTGINNNSPSSMIFTANASFNNSVTNYGTGGNTPTNVTIAASTSYWDNIIK